MRFLRKIVDKQESLHKAPDAPLHKVWPLLDAGETFMFSPSEKAPKTGGPHVRDYVDLKRVMATVILALLPAIAWSIYNTGVQHFELIAQGGMIDGAGYMSGWLQGLLFGAHYAPNVAGPTFMDLVIYGIQKMAPIIVVSYMVGLLIEGLFAVIRKEEVSEGYLVTGILIALIVPASIPLWQLAVAVAFAVVLVKEVFGGTGMNIFNVALMARAFLFFAYPAQISGDSVWVSGNGDTGLVDGMSKATPLAVGAQAKVQAAHDQIAIGAAGVSEHVSPETAVGYLQDGDGVKYFADASDAIREAGYTWWEMFAGLIPGSAGETSALCALIGALLLVVTGFGSWITMVSGVIGLLVTAVIMFVFAGGLDGIGSVSPMDHLVMGGFAFGIVFMATDPVSSPESSRGKWVYGFLIGAVTVMVRAVNPAYPEGVMLAILLLNAFAPTIDHFVVAANMKRRKARLG